MSATYISAFSLTALLHCSTLVMAGDTDTNRRPVFTSREISLAGHPFRVELAVTSAQRSTGLMYRDGLPEGTGMLFPFDPPAPVSFWMKNVRLPLDLLFFDRNGCLLGHHDRVPPCTDTQCPVYSSQRPISWVLEVPAGTREQLSLMQGDCVLHPIR